MGRLFCCLLFLIFFTVACRTQGKAVQVQSNLFSEGNHCEGLAITEKGNLFGLHSSNTVFMVEDDGRRIYFNQSIGAKPYEISSIAAIASGENQICLYDKGNSRFSLYSYDYGYLESIPVDEKVADLKLFNGIVYYLCEDECKADRPLIRTAGKQTDEFIFLEKNKEALPVLFDISENYVLLAYKTPSASLKIYEKRDNGTVHRIPLPGRVIKGVRNSSGDKIEVLSDLALDEEGKLIIAAFLSGETPALQKQELNPFISFMNLKGQELAMVSFPPGEHQERVELKIAVNRKESLLYVTDGANIYKIDYEKVASHH